MLYEKENIEKSTELEIPGSGYMKVRSRTATVTTPLLTGVRS